MTTELVLLLSFAWCVGVVCGFVFRALVIETRRKPQPPAGTGQPVDPGHTDTVSDTKTVTFAAGQRRVIMVFAAGAFLLGVSANVLTYRNGEADDTRTACNSEYNRLDGLARDDRDLAARLASAADLVELKAELDVWTSIREQTADPAGTDEDRLARFLETIDAKLASIAAKITAVEATQATRERSPYPDPHACDDGKIDKDEIPKPNPDPVNELSPEPTERPSP